jgi:hypothetical protein
MRTAEKKCLDERGGHQGGYMEGWVQVEGHGGRGWNYDYYYWLGWTLLLLAGVVILGCPDNILGAGPEAV